MSVFLRIGGWVIAAFAIAIAVVLGQQLQETRTQLAAATRTSSERENQTKSKIENLVELQQATEARTQELEKKLEEASATDAALEPESAEALQDGSEEKPAETAKSGDGGPSNMFKSMGDMFKGEKGKALAKTSAEMQANMRYGKFFKDLALPADVEQQAREILSKSIEEQMQVGFKQMSDEKLDPEQVAKGAKVSEKQTRDDLSKVLSADEMAQYDQYQEEMPRHVLEQQYDMQLTMGAPSITPESRDIIKQTLVEETLSGNPDFGRPGSRTDTNPASVFEGQLAAIDRARERLAAELDENEFAQAERFLNQQRQQAEMMRDMMGNMMNENKESTEAKPK